MRELAPSIRMLPHAVLLTPVSIHVFPMLYTFLLAAHHHTWGFACTYSPVVYIIIRRVTRVPVAVSVISAIVIIVLVAMETMVIDLPGGTEVPPIVMIVMVGRGGLVLLLKCTIYQY